MVNKILYNTALVAASFIFNVCAFEINLNTLHLTNADKNSKVNSMLDAYGMNYETVRLPVTTLTLENNNVALYNAIVVEDATQEMLATIRNQIEDYQRKYKVRVAYLNCEPDPYFGFKSSTKSISERDFVELTKEGLELAKKYQMNGKDVKFKSGTCVPNAQHECDKYYHYMVEINNDIVPLLKYNNTESYGGGIVKTKDIESIHFFNSNIESTIAPFVAHLWISWTNYGIIDGFRRLYLSTQVDDFFISNPFDAQKGTEFRTSIQDMKNLAKWEKEIASERMPKGSQYKVELAFNGWYVLKTADHKHSIAVDWTLYGKPRDYVKPLSEVGSHKFPEEIDSDWDDAALRKDELYNYFAKNPEAQDDFYWLTHTFSHHNLDYASYHDADVEISLNVKMADDPYLGMYKRDCFSPHSIVCPEISGLHNGHALQAFTANKVNYGVGDTSRRDLDPDNWYFPLVTNQTTSNFDDFLIIPRIPTEMYWDCSTVDQILTLYKKKSGGKETTWEAHLQKEADSHVKNFLELRHDPYMFHEGNLRNADVGEFDVQGVKGQFGLLQQWVERIVIEIKKYLDWPLITKKMDDLVETYKTRISQKQCMPKYTMVVDDSSMTISEIKVASTNGECNVPLFAIRDTKFDESTVDSIEQIGDEPATAWIKATTEPKSVKFTNDIKWNDDSFTGKYVESVESVRSSSNLTYSVSILKNCLLACGILLFFLLN
jgi:hypothetical protein